VTQKERHLQALNNFTDQVKDDPNVIALLLNGSLAYGTVWEKSDIDLVMLVRDGTVSISNLCVEEEGIYISLSLNEVSKFKRDMQKWRGDNSQSQFALGTIVFTKDENLREFIEDMSKIGEDDAVISFLSLFNNLWANMIRAEKWITVLNDPLYAQRFLQWCCTTIADMELIRHHELPTRESILRVQELNPKLMEKLYIIPSTKAMSQAEVRYTLDLLNNYLEAHMDWWSKPILKFLEDGEIKTSSYMAKHFNIGGLYPVDYLVQKGIVIKVTQPTQLFKKSKLTVEEISYFYLKEGQ